MSFILLDMLDPLAPRVRARFDSFPFDPAFLAYAHSDPDTKLLTDAFDENSSFTFLLPRRTAVSFVCGHPDRLAPDDLDRFLSLINRPLIFSVPNSNWLQKLTPPAPHKSWQVPRVDYTFVRDPASFPSPSAQILPLDDALLPRVRDEADPDFDPTAFRALNAFGHVALVENHIASVAWSPSIAGWAEIAVSTAPSHRQKGLARAIGQATLHESLRRNLRPHVSTNQQNTPARRWAESLNFSNPVPHNWAVIHHGLSNPISKFENQKGQATKDQ